MSASDTAKTLWDKIPPRSSAPRRTVGRVDLKDAHFASPAFSGIRRSGGRFATAMLKIASLLLALPASALPVRSPLSLIHI